MNVLANLEINGFVHDKRYKFEKSQSIFTFLFPLEVMNNENLA